MWLKATSTKSARAFAGYYTVSLVTEKGVECYKFVNQENEGDIIIVPVSEVKWGSNYETLNPNEIPKPQTGGKKKGKSRSKRNRNKKTSKRRR
jgi:hypothetical protein